MDQPRGNTLSSPILKMIGFMPFDVSILSIKWKIVWSKAASVVCSGLPKRPLMEVVLLSTFCYCKFEEEIVHVFWAKRKNAKAVVTFILCFIYRV